MSLSPGAHVATAPPAVLHIRWVTPLYDREGLPTSVVNPPGLPRKATS
ncbi:MAG: hypothetical protein L0I76_12025 [Pseudonocardia sp.]|nr:hypothetical protein [Pseudonocardia sp.]